MKSKTRKVLLGAATLAAASAIAGNVQAATTDSIPITARIVAAVSITSVQALNFGVFSVPTAVGTATVSPNGNRAVSAAITPIGGGNQAGQYKVIAAGGVGFSVIAPASATVKNAGAVTMKVNAFKLGKTTAATGVASPFKTTIAGTGKKSDTFAIGGTLNIGAGQATGTYTGAVKLTVAYQ